MLAKTYFKSMFLLGFLTFFAREGPKKIWWSHWSVDSYLEFYFAISKYLDYMQYCMMPLEQCGQTVVKSLATVASLGQEHVHVCFVT